MCLDDGEVSCGAKLLPPSGRRLSDGGPTMTERLSPSLSTKRDGKVVWVVKESLPHLHPRERLGD